MSTSRQLLAILFADIQGYTALMQRDEAKAIQLKDKFQRDLESEIRWRGGRVAVFSGDGALCVFKSAIEAVRAAIAVQGKMLEEPVVPLRIGIHTGDVVTEGKNVYGDGVNVASRLESFAVPGSVFISGKVADEIKNQPGIEIVALGKFEFKNVHGPVEIFAVKNDKLVVPKREELTGKGSRIAGKRYASKRIWIGSAVLLLLLALSIFVYKKYNSATASAVVTGPQVNTIAVLPFANLSGQKDDEYFADGMCDEILTQISKISAINVLSRTSTLQFRDTKKTMKEIGEQIGANVLLEGSVQKIRDQVRIIVKLINATNDKPLWAETYDRQLKDVFFIQSDIAEQIAQALNATLTKREEELFSEKPTENLKAFDLYLRGNKYAEDFWSNSKMEKVPDAISMFEQAIALDPKFVNAYDALISLYTEIAWRKPIINYEDYRVKAKEWLDRMLALKIDKPVVHATVYIYKYEGERDYPGALAELDQIDKYFGNDKQTVDLRAYVLRRMGRIEEALRLFQRRARAYPKETFIHSEIASTYSLLRNADSAIYSVDKTIQMHPDKADFYVEKAGFFTDLKGDIRKAKQVLNSGTAFIDTTELADFRIYLDMLEGNYGSAISHLSDRADSMWSLTQSYATTSAQMIAVMLNNQGNKEEA
ncbi:MAG TPA: adenylate/guanylate cyclase domain-containing protein, partial [Chitinophagaceae bacterium]|nr:adenylate/guanylate cyclase domain-containing protein [Chitinophagaceae bacterium]